MSMRSRDRRRQPSRWSRASRRWNGRSACPAEDGEIEIRQMFELEDFGESKAIDRFREMGVGAKR